MLSKPELDAHNESFSGGSSLALLPAHGTEGKVQRVYYVDEAGDGVLFDRKGRYLVGSEGCSRFFVLGCLWVEQPDTLAGELAELRTELLCDPYFAGVPSFDPARGRTACCFHAKDDPPEVRREVYRLLLRHGLKLRAVVRDKLAVLDYVRQRNRANQEYHYHPNELYDYTVRRLFRELLHGHESYSVYFAERGKADRTAALYEALSRAQRSFGDPRVEADTSLPPVQVHWASPHNLAPLQATDYLLWAVQRAFEREELRYLEYVQPLVSLVMDVDDQRLRPYGEYYTKRAPLTVDKLRQRKAGDIGSP